jgi:hypothetical protein
MYLSDAIIEQSTFYQLLREKFLDEGLEQGLQQGHLQEARRAVRTVLEVRFPGLDITALEEIQDLAKLEQLHREILAAPDVSVAKAAIGTAASF